MTGPRGGWPAAVGLAAALGAASLLLPATLGYDAWAWAVWGRQLAHLDLATTAGPSFKPLPVLMLAPLSVLGGATPVVWMGLMRAAAVLSLVLAYRVGARLAGPLAGAVAALSLALSADLYRTALLGSAEPALIALTLGGVDRHLAGRRDWALVLIALAGLIRPEAWVLLGLYGVYVWLREPGLRPLAVAAVVLAPVLWLGLDWIGSGDPLHGSSTATSATEGSAANASVPAFEVVRRAADAIILPTLLLAGVGIVAGVRRRDRAVLSLAALALGWIAVVAIMAEVGFTGTRRYLAAPAAALCVLAGVGLVWLLDAVTERRVRLAVAGAIGLLALVPAVLRAREDARMLSVARSQADQRDELRRAVARVGGRTAVLRSGRPAINPWLQTALAWELSVHLSGVQATWASSKRHPHWAPPALVFRAPSRLAGPRPALPVGVTADTIARSGRWRVLRAGA
ncbi:MAG TPA: hypothetical protein VFY32_00830 [Solirubrobacteraceae bacterium]|nr:hypothetical protein [Solirubrobacteraceae bacterium]